jgi:hypothetical protein
MTQENIRYRRDVAIQAYLKARKGKRRSRHLLQPVQVYVSMLREARSTRVMTREQLVQQEVSAYFAGQRAA